MRGENGESDGWEGEAKGGRAAILKPREGIGYGWTEKSSKVSESDSFFVNKLVFFSALSPGPINILVNSKEEESCNVYSRARTQSKPSKVGEGQRPRREFCFPPKRPFRRSNNICKRDYCMK